MTLTISFAWWWIPALATLFALFSPYLFARYGDPFSERPAIFYWAFGFFISTILWIIFAILK